MQSVRPDGRPKPARQSSISSIDAALRENLAGRKTTVPVHSLDPRFVHHLHKLYADAHVGVSDGRIGLQDLQSLVQSRIDHLMNEDRQDLARLQEDVMKSHGTYEIEEDRWTDRFDTKRTIGQKAADNTASGGGSWTFIIVLLAFLASWMIINLSVPKGWDPYPFILLNLMLSTLAALQAPIIMMSQNRQTAIDQAQGDYISRMTLRAELRLRHVDAKIDHLVSHQWKRLLEIQQLQTDLLYAQLQSKGEEGSQGSQGSQGNPPFDSTSHPKAESPTRPSTSNLSRAPTLETITPSQQWKAHSHVDDHLNLLLRAHHGVALPSDTLVFSRWHDSGDNYVGSVTDVRLTWKDSSSAAPGVLKHVEYTLEFQSGVASMDDVFAGEGLLTLRNDFDMPEMNLKGRILTIKVHTTTGRTHHFTNGYVLARYKPTILPHRGDHISDLFKEPLDRVVLTYRGPIAHAVVAVPHEGDALTSVRTTLYGPRAAQGEVWCCSVDATTPADGWTCLAAVGNPNAEPGWRKLETKRGVESGSHHRGEDDGDVDSRTGGVDDDMAVSFDVDLDLVGPGLWALWTPNPKATFTGMILSKASVG
ncbi:hypothetical protein HKX48_002174 [Thoreauomyces humboldtii]|nr:hypothetical protein HKX48_002174 [Thoreauomyces humboldtii]